jgi:hypothetical protein
MFYFKTGFEGAGNWIGGYILFLKLLDVVIVRGSNRERERERKTGF